jgi:hypothetical protein
MDRAVLRSSPSRLRVNNVGPLRRRRFVPEIPRKNTCRKTRHYLEDLHGEDYAEFGFAAFHSCEALFYFFQRIFFDHRAHAREF